MTISFFIIYSILIEKDFGVNSWDYYTALAMYLIIFGLLFIVNYYKYQESFSDYEIEEIGKVKN